jgi:hypothetical protein
LHQQHFGGESEGGPGWIWEFCSLSREGKKVILAKAVTAEKEKRGLLKENFLQTEGTKSSYLDSF